MNKYPEWAGRTVLIQVATSTSEQSELLTTVSDICTRIDRGHSSLVHQPLVFLKQDLDFPQYLALLSAADVLMSSALRDGMNLTGEWSPLHILKHVLTLVPFCISVRLHPMQ